VEGRMESEPSNGHARQLTGRLSAQLRSECRTDTQHAGMSGAGVWSGWYGLGGRLWDSGAPDECGRGGEKRGLGGRVQPKIPTV